MEHLSYAQAGDWNEREPQKPFAEMPARQDFLKRIASVEMEPGWQATRALLRIEHDELLALMLRPSFRPVRDLDLVPVTPCELCLDGGMRTAGSLRTRHGRELVHVCDTCGTIRIGELGPIIAPRPHPHA